MMLNRQSYRDAIEKAIRRTPVCALLGPRQCGKTTLAKSIALEQPASHFFDLESPQDQLRLSNPELALSRLQGLVVLDEIQTRPDLFPVLRVLADRPAGNAQFLVLGSASPDLVRQSSQTLAGRVEFVDMHGFDLREVGVGRLDDLWVRGGFPRSFLAGSEEDSVAWREGFVRTFLERDLPQLGIQIASTVMRRFWTMLAHSHGQTWNGSELGRSMGLSDKTVKNYMEILTQTFMVRQLQPWFENTAKRQVKSPKVYLRDSGVLHHLLSLPDARALHMHPRVGASWEGFALEQVLRMNGGGEAYFWATQSGAELDLLIFQRGKRIGYEFKASEKPVVTKSMRIAMQDLGLSHLHVICPGSVCSELDEGITATGLAAIVF